MATPTDRMPAAFLQLKIQVKNSFVTPSSVKSRFLMPFGLILHIELDIGLSKCESRNCTDIYILLTITFIVLFSFCNEKISLEGNWKFKLKRWNREKLLKLTTAKWLHTRACRPITESDSAASAYCKK